MSTGSKQTTLIQVQPELLLKSWRCEPWPTLLRGKVHWSDNKNPSDRYNTFYARTLSDSSLLKDCHGEKVNVTEKPPELDQQLMALHCVPGDDVLVLGSGTGSDVIGAINCGCNVYGVERDRKQYDAAITRITKLVNEKGVSLAEEKRQAEVATSNKR
jgi:cyclopropane fatty-acyl-phospholipid synthase-like methyltransferase